MTVSIANTYLSDSFNTWRNNTNLAATTISNNAVTVAKAGRGGYTVGDAHVNGTFSTTEMVAHTLRGGDWNTEGVLTIASNTIINGANIHLNTTNRMVLNGNVIIDTNGTEIFHLGEADRIRIAGGTAGQFLRTVDRTSGTVELKDLTLLDVRDMSSNSAHLVLSSANTSFDSFGRANNSPALIFTTVSGTDRAAIYLATPTVSGAPTSGQSDLIIQLVDTAGQSNVVIVDSSNNVVYTIDSNGNVEGDGRTVVVGLTSSDHVLPASDDAIDLGASGTEFRNLYIDGTANIDTLSLSDTNGEGVSTNIVPTADSSKNLGSDTYRWATVYSDASNTGTISASGDVHFESDMYVDGFSTFTDNVTFNSDNVTFTSNVTFGESSTMYINGTVVMGNQITDTFTAVANTDLQGDVIIGSANADFTTINAEIKSNLVPNATDTYDIGKHQKQWRNIFVKNANVATQLTVNGDTDLNSVTVTTLTANGASNLKGAVDIDSSLNVDGSSTLNGLTVTTLTANGAVNIKGATDIDSTLNVDGATTLNGVTATTLTANGTVNLKGATDIDSTLNVDGSSTLNGLTVTTLTANGATTIKGAADLQSSLNVDGDTTLNGLTVTTLTANGSSTFVREVGFSSNTTFSANAVFNANAYFEADMHINGNIYVGNQLSDTMTVTANTDLNGDVDIGNANSDLLTISSEIDSSLVPSSNNTYSLGKHQKQWKNVFTQYANVASDLTIGGDVSVDGSATITQDLDVTGDLTVTGTTTISGGAGFTAANGTFTNLDVIANTTLGTSAADSIAINAQVNTSIDLKSNTRANLGSASGRWHVVYANTINVAANADISGVISNDDKMLFGATGKLHANNTISNGAILRAMIAADAIDGTKIADDSINSEHYVDGSIDTAHIGNSQVTAAKIASDAVTAVKIASNAVETAKIDDGAVTAAKIANQGLTANTLASNAVETAKIDDGAVTAAKIANQGLTANTLASNAVETAKIDDGAVTAAKIANEGLGSNTLASLAVTTAKIAEGAVTASKIANQGLASNCYGDNSIELGTKTTGNYVRALLGTTNEITVANTGTEGGTFTVGLPNDVTITRDLNVGQDLAVSGNLTVSGTMTTVDTTNMVVKDSLIALNSGAGTNSNDLGFIFNRGSTGSNAIFVWDESADRFMLGTGNMAATRTGNLTITKGILTANLDGTATTANKLQTTRNIGVKLTGDVTGYANTNFDGSNNVRIDVSTTIGANKVALGTDTTGDYVRQVTANTSANGIAVYTNVSESGNVVVTNTRPFDRIFLTDGGSSTVELTNNKWIKFVEGDEIDITWTDTTPGSKSDPFDLTFDHKNVTRTNNTSTASPAHGGTFTAIDSITSNARGHITAVNTKTVTLPKDGYTLTANTSGGTNADPYLNLNDVDGTGLDQVQITGGTNCTVTRNSDGQITIAASTNADTVDSLHASSFIRSDADDNVSGHTEWQDNYQARFGNGADMAIYHDGSHNFIESNNSVLLRVKGTDQTGTAAGGDVQIEGGNGGETSGDGGDVTITSGARYSSSSLFTQGGSASFLGGNSVRGGDASIYGGTGSYNNTSGGPVKLFGGDSKTSGGSTGFGCQMYIEGASSSGQGGGAILVSGSSVGTNIPGSDIDIKAGRGTGSATPGDIIFYTSSPGSSGSTQHNAQVERARINEDGIIASQIYTNEYLKHNGDGDTYVRLMTDQVIIGAGGVEMISCVEDTTDYVDIVDRVRVTAAGDLECEGDVVAYTSTSISDINQKENITKIDSALDKVSKLNGYTFDWKNTGESSAGVIAQEVEEVLPEIVKEKTIRDGDPHKTVEYNGLVGMLIEAMKEQQSQIEAMKAEIDELKANK